MSDPKPQSPLREITQPFIDLVHAPRALWGLNLSYLLEGFAYFGLAYYMAMYFTQYVGLGDRQAHYMVAPLTSGITFAMLIFGGRVDRWGVRRTLLIAIVLMALGRFVLAFAPGTGLPGGQLLSALNGLALAGILLVVIGFGMYQPALYAGTRQITTPATSGMAFAMLYAMNNLGGWLPTFMGPIRERFGLAGGIGFYGLVSVLGLFLVMFVLTNKTWKTAVEAAKTTEPAAVPTETSPVTDPLPVPTSRGTRVLDWFRNHPLADGKFTFFIFSLIPVQTLFVWNILVLPQYVQRTFVGTWLGKNFEAATAFNSLLIFILCPLVAALTAKAKVYRMMILGTAVMGLSPFLLVAGGDTAPAMVAYILMLSIGEAMWQPRFLQLAAEIAPEGRTGVYMGVAQLPWFLTKAIVPLYSGAAMARWCPADGIKSTTTLWIVSGCIAMVSATVLLLAQGWIGKDFKTKRA